MRQSRGLSLAELADATGLTSSTLSRLETGKRRATLDQVLSLAEQYGVPLDQLVGVGQIGDPRVYLRPVVRDGMTYVPLTRRPGGIQAFKVVYPPASVWGPPRLKTHTGHEWFYVMSGRVRLVLLEQEHQLQPGEVAEFDTAIPHWIGSLDEQPAELLTMMGPQGERAEVAVSRT